MSIAKLKKSENIFEGEDGDSDDLRFARRTVSPAERERRAKDPRWRITEELRKILSSAGIINFGDALANWGAIPKSAKNDTDARRKWESKWARAEDAFTHFARNNPELFVDAGFPEAMDTERGLEDRFDPQDVIYKIPEWRNDFDSGNYVSADAASEDADPIIAGARRAAFDSLTEGLAPHERETQYWDGHYNMPELEKAPLERLSRQNSKGGRFTFTNAGEEFTARRAQGTGGWIIENAHGLREELEAGASVWVDRGHLQTVEREASAKDAEADVKRAEAAIKKAESKKSDADAKKAEADARKAEATAAAETARIEANKLSSEAAIARAQAAAAEAEKAKADADKAAAEAEKAKAERDSAREETRKARAEADKVKAELQAAKNKVWEARAKAEEAKAKLRKAKRTRSEAVKTLIKEIADETVRLRAIRGKRASTMDINANKRLENVVKNLGADIEGKIGKAIEYFQTLAIDDIRNNPDSAQGLLNDITRWQEGRAAMPQFVRDELEASIQEAVAYLSTERVRATLSFINEVKKEGRFNRGMQAFAAAMTFRNNIEKQIMRMDTNGKIRRELVRAPYARAAEAAKEAKNGGFPSLGDIIWGAVRGERLFMYFDGTAGIKGGDSRLNDPSLLSNVVLDPLFEGDANRQTGIETVVEIFKTFIDGLDPLKDQNKYLMAKQDGKKKAEPLMITLRTEDDERNKILEDYKITIADAMFVYQHSQNEDGRRHLVGSGFTEDDVDGNLGTITQIINALPENRKKAVDATIDYYDNEQYARVNAVFEREHHVPMLKVPRYSPIRDLDVSGRTAGQIIKDGDDFRRAGVKKNMTKGRVMSHLPFSRFNFYTINVSAMIDAETYIAMNDPVRNANKYLRDGKLSKAMKIKNEVAYKELISWLDDAVRPADVPQDWLNRAANTLARNFAVAKLAGNLLTMMKQSISGLTALPYVSKAQMLKAAAVYEAHPVKTPEMIKSKSALMRNRAESIERVFVEMAERGPIGKIVKARLSPHLSAKENAEQVIEMTNTFLMSGIQEMDMYTAGVVWLAKYGEVLGLTNDEKTAIRAADTLVRRTQSQGGNLHLSSAFRSRNAFVRALTMFANDSNQNWNLLVEAVMGWKNRGAAKSTALILWHGLMPALATHIVTSGIASIPLAWPWDEPEDWDEWLKDTIRMWASPEDFIDQIPGVVLGGIPVVGGAASLATKIGTNVIRERRGKDKDRYFPEVGASPMQGVFGDIGSIAEDISRRKKTIRDKDKDLSKKDKDRRRADWENIAEAALTLRGIGGYVPYWRIRGTAESEDPRRILWSKYALTDKSVDAAMVKRASKSIISDPEKFEQFVDWYEKIGQKRWYDRDAEAKDGATAGKSRQSEFVRYYERILDKIADEDTDKGFRMMEESGIFSDNMDTPPNALLLNWAKNRRRKWTDGDRAKYRAWASTEDQERKKANKEKKAAELYRRLRAVGQTE
jgi:hypothetical protein